jgi:predicted amidophosphoribosyltransferase
MTLIDSCALCFTPLWMPSAALCKACISVLTGSDLAFRQMKGFPVFSLLQYVWPAHELIKLCKQNSNPALIKTLSQALALNFLEQNYVRVAGVVPIPPKIMGATDHAQSIALSISEIMGVPIFDKLLKRKELGAEQKLQSLANRAVIKIEKIQNADLSAIKDLNGALILIDDIVTSGTTLTQAWRCLERPEAMALTLAARPLFSLVN